MSEDGNVRFLNSAGGEDIDHLPIGRDGFRHELAHGGGDLLGSLLAVRALFVQCGLNALEKTHVVADLRRFIAGGARDKRRPVNGRASATPGQVKTMFRWGRDDQT